MALNSSIFLQCNHSGAFVIYISSDYNTNDDIISIHCHVLSTNAVIFWHTVENLAITLVKVRMSTNEIAYPWKT